jgi:molybdate transport system substrate-binding protein
MRRLAPILVMLTTVATMSAGAFSAWAGERVLVFAAASTRDAMEDAIRAFPQASVNGVYAATPALARQILDGAPASIFLSASRAWADIIEDAGALLKRRDFLRNRLVLIAPAAEPPDRRIEQAADIPEALAGGRLAMADTRSVPAGIYGRQALTALGAWSSVGRRVARASNARTALLLVERGETPLGIVYRTDALASPEVSTVWSIPSTAHDPIVYPLALVRTAESNPDAIAFLEFLASTKGRRIFERHGFETD